MREQDDRDLFRGTAHWYARYRPGYPADFIAEIISRFDLDGSGSLLDLGCGPGQLALPLAPHVAEVIGMDPQPDMLAEADRAAREAGIANVRWLLGSSTDLGRLRDDLPGVRGVVMGRSFHWMDPDATLESLSRIVLPGGSIVIAGDGCGVWDDDEAWQIATREVIQRWLGTERRAGTGVASIPTGPWHEQGAVARSSFVNTGDYVLTFERQWDIDRIVGFLYSTSFCSPAVLGDLLPAFERDLRQALATLNPEGRFSEQVRLGATFARLPE
jgi:SAM-dependent methyltransferase